MPTYQANPFYSDPNIQQAAQSLAETLAGGSARRMNAEIAGNQARADLDATRAREAASYASANSSNALAGKYGAETGILNRKAAALDGLAKVWADPSKDFNTKMREMGQFIAAGELTEADVSSYFLLGPAHGMTMDQMDPYVFARDGEYGNTMQAWNREPETAFVDGVPTYVERQKAYGMQAPVSETDAKGFSFLQLPPVDQQSILFGETGTTDIMGPNGPQVAATRTAIRDGATPILSETEAKGAAILSGDAPAASAYAGTAMEAQHFNIVEDLYQKAKERPLTDVEARRYANAYAALTEPKTSMREGVDGNVYTITVPARSIPYPSPEDLFGAGRGPQGPQTPAMPVDPGMAPPPRAAAVYPSAPQPATTPRLPQDPWTPTPVTPPGMLSLPTPMPPQPGPAMPRTAPAAPPQFGSAPAAPAAPRPSLAFGLGASPSSAAGPVTSTAGTPPGVATATRVEGLPAAPEGKKITEMQLRLMDLGGAFGSYLRDLAVLVDYDPATDTFGPNSWFPGAWYDITTGVETSGFPLAGYVGRSVRGDKGNDYASVAFGVVEPLLRLRTGAAAPETEQVGYRLGILPQSGLSDEVNQNRIRRLYRQLASYEYVANQMGLSLVELDAIALSDPSDERVIRARIEAEKLIDGDPVAQDENPASTQAPEAMPGVDDMGGWIDTPFGRGRIVSP